MRQRPGVLLVVATVVGVGMPAPAAADVVSIPRTASAAKGAVRLDPPAGECQIIAATVDKRHPGTQQLIVRTNDWNDTTAIVQLATEVGGKWTCGREMVGRVGRNGVRPLLQRRSNDGTAPAGVFPLATMTAWDGQRFSFFGNSPDPGVRAGTYRSVRTGDCFGATPNTPGYGHLRNDTACAGADDEYLPDFVGSYSHAALIGANMEPNVSGDAPGEIPYAAAIFLHRHAYNAAGTPNPTSGCVSLELADLVDVLRALRRDVQFVIGPTDWLLAGAA
jgi:L,D-peptidoglycan transpeptidase YkuD (ErfK/YbiS/YcfS/YnhG family)